MRMIQKLRCGAGRCSRARIFSKKLRKLKKFFLRGGRRVDRA